MLSIRFCYALQFGLVLHLEFHSSCLFLEEFSQASWDCSTPLPVLHFLCITCTSYWSLVSVFIIFYHRGFFVTQWNEIKRFFLSALLLGWNWRFTIHGYFNSHFPTLYPFTCFVILLQFCSSFVLFLKGLFWTVSHFCQTGENKCKCTSALTWKNSQSMKLVCHMDKQSCLLILTPFILPVCSAVYVPSCVTNEWTFCSLTHNYFY